MADSTNKFLFLAVLSVLILVGLALPKGFDISDEGLYVLLAHPLQENNAGIFNYDLFFKGFYQCTGIHFGIIGLRILRLISYVVAAFAFSFFWKNIAEEKGLSFKIAMISFLGISAGYGFLPSSLSYNSLSVCLTGLWLACVSFKTKSPLLKVLVLGLILGLLVYVKVTTALLLALISVSILIYEDKKSISSLILLFVPFVVLELAFFLFLDTFSTLRMIQGLEFTVSRPDYGFFILVKHTFFGFFWCFLVFLSTLILKKISSNPWINFGITVFILVLIFFQTRITEEWNHIFLLIMPLIFGILTHSKLTALTLSSRKYWVLLLLFLPFILHFGSNVYWLRLGIHYWIFWCLAAMIWLDKVYPFAEKYLVYFISFSSLILVLNGLWWSPFAQKSIWEATEKWEYLPGKSIFLTPQQVLQLKVIKNQMPDESPSIVLAAYRIPGIPYLLGKTIPISPGFWDKTQLENYFPKGIQESVLLYYPLDELPAGEYGKIILIPDFDE